MKIAIVGPSPVPFTIGGCENLLWGLCDAINQKTEHQAELIKLPLRERNFWDLVESYYEYYKLDLSHFDMIISTKYPSWMVRHDNSICYMVHTLRGLYDTYQNKNQPYEVVKGNPDIDRIVSFMEKHPCPYSLDYFFEMLLGLKNIGSIPEEYFRFPGALIRKVIHYMDNWGLSQKGVRRYFSISKTVRDRQEYFPEGSRVEVVYPPTTLKEPTCKEYKYIFMISRLDAPKRISMLIDAMRYVKSDIDLLIAGTGPEKEKLMEQAKDDKRIKFLGYVRDEEVEDYYSNGLVIPYFPYDEDYGLITIEAFQHRKPVITTIDAGGPTEFVENGQTGFIVDFKAKAIAEKIDILAQAPHEARRMGENGYQKVQDITWQKAVEQLLGFLKETVQQEVLSDFQLPAAKTRKKAVVTLSFPVFPAQTGGQARVYSLYKQIAAHMDVEVISFANPDAAPVNGYIADGLAENRIKKSKEHFEKETELREQMGVSIGDVALFSMAGLTPEFREEFIKAEKEADAVIVCHPFCYPAIKPYLKDKLFIYDAQDVEYILKKSILPDTPQGRDLSEQVFRAEKECCDRSELIVVCSKEDADSFQQIYGVPEDKIIVIPNGVDCEDTAYTAFEDRKINKRKYGLENETLALFMGSYHKPNLDACEEIFHIAEKFPQIKFLLMGSQCYNYKGRKLPENVGLLGIVSEEAKNRVFSMVDFALNPMMSGTGTNLKMFDYMAAGIPVITTRFGTRGIDNKEVFILSEMEEMEEAIRQFDAESAASKSRMARKYVEEVFDWSIATKPMVDVMEELLAYKEEDK